MKKRKTLFEPLEQRILLSGDGLLDDDICSSSNAELLGPSTDLLEPDHPLVVLDQQDSIVAAEASQSPKEAPNLPGLKLIDPDTSCFDGQVFHLDFDGAEDVTYNGPETIGPFDVPAFLIPEALSGKEGEITAFVIDELSQIFGPYGITFTAEKPDAGDGPFSTIYVTIPSHPLAEISGGQGLAEGIDSENLNRSDQAFVFVPFQTQSQTIEGISSRLSSVVSHEVGHLLGYAHDDPSPNSFAELAASFYQTYGSSRTENHIVIAGSHYFEANNIVANMTTYWFVNGTHVETDTSGLFAVDPDLTRTISSGTTNIQADIYYSTGTFKEYHIWNMTVDTTGPTTPGTPDMASGSDSGSSSSDNITNDNAPSFSWSASSDSGSGVSGYEYKLGSSGTPVWVGNTTSYTLPSQSDGSRSIYVRAKDNANNYSSWSSGLTFVIDTTDPGLPTHQSPTNGGTVQTLQPTLQWSAASDTNGIWKYHLKVVENWLPYYDKVDKDVTGTSYALLSSEALQWEKNYVWRLYAVDTAGNDGSYTTEWNFTVDDVISPTAPGTPDMASGSDSGSSSSDNITNDNTPSFTWTASSDRYSERDSWL